MKNKLLLIFLVFINLWMVGQLPETDVWLFKIKSNKIGELYLQDSLNITHRKGYDNQPSFSLDEKQIYFVSVKEDNQADVYAYDIKKNKTIQVTKTPDSEYSPTTTSDGKLFWTVAVEPDSSQKMHAYNSVDGTFNSKFNFDSVAYFTFLNEDTLIYYKLTDPHSLRMRAIKTGEDKFICNTPVRGFKKISRSKLIFGIKDSSEVNFYIYDFMLQKAIHYCAYKSTSEDIIWHKDLGLLKSEGYNIYQYNETKKTWLLLFDLSSYGIKKITRLLIDSKTKLLVIVNNT